MTIIATPTEGYEELKVWVERLGDTHGFVRISGRFGEWEDKLELDLQPEEAESALASASRGSEMQIPVKRSGSVDRLDPMREVGERLFSALFWGERSSLFRRATQTARAERKGLRLRLSVEDERGEWVSLPWEFMHDGDHFINLSSWSPLVRTVGVSNEPQGPVHPPLRVLAVAADVTGKMQTERGLDVLRDLEPRYGNLEVTVVSQATRDEFIQAVRGTQFQVLHFIGGARHSRDGLPALVLMDEDREPIASTELATRDQLVDASTLQRLLRGKPELRLVLLSTCYTARLATELASHVPALIGMLGWIESAACTAFTQALYYSLLDGGSLEDAMTEGRQMVSLRFSGSRAWGMPVLYLQTPDGVLLGRLPEALGFEAVLSEAEEKAPGTAPTDPARHREWQKLLMMREMQQRNLKELEGQRQASIVSVSFVESQILDAEEQIASLEEQLRDLESRET